MDAVELIRQEWKEGARHFEEYREDPRRYRALVEQLEAVLDELRKQIGQTFTLAELADAYRDAERWARDIVVSPRDLSIVLAAAFHSYQRGAVDYAP
jgi:L-lactate utilization protein LutB